MYIQVAQQHRGFRVVIASATIDPAPFLRFFNLTTPALSVPGRVFPVTLTHAPIGAGSGKVGGGAGGGNNLGAVVRRWVVPAVQRVLREQPEGHVLVFLPGQAEISVAVSTLRNSRDIPDNVQALPLSGSLTPSEQQQVSVGACACMHV